MVDFAADCSFRVRDDRTGMKILGSYEQNLLTQLRQFTFNAKPIFYMFYELRAKM